MASAPGTPPNHVPVRVGSIHPSGSFVYPVSLALVLLGAATLKLVLLSRSLGFEQGDPLEYINIAHTIAYGTGEEWWDIRPLLFPLVLVPLIWLGDWLPDPTGDVAVRLLRLAPLLFSLGCIAVGASIARTLSGRLGAVVTAFVLATNSIFNQLSVAPFAEIPATFGVLCAALIAIRGGISIRSGLMCAIALGLACMARYQSLAFIAPFGLWMLLTRRPRRLIGFIGGLVGCTAMQAGLDLIAYGAPFHSLIQSATYNVTSDEAASFYGSDPFIWYIQTVGEWFGYPALVLAAIGSFIGLRSASRGSWALILGLALTMIFWLSAIAHKEPRFTSQIAPFLAIGAGHGAWYLIHNRPAWTQLIGILAIAGATLPGIWQTMLLNLTFNPGFVDGPKRVSNDHPGAVLGTIPWFIARPYTFGRIQLVRADVDRWSDRAYMAEIVEQSDYILLREYDFASDRFIQRLVDSKFRTIERYPDQVVLLQNRQRAEPRQPARRER
ncbi:MAG: hypothetical protein ACKVVP_07635 [Chloroflexota bacterium]